LARERVKSRSARNFLRLVIALYSRDDDDDDRETTTINDRAPRPWESPAVTIDICDDDFGAARRARRGDAGCHATFADRRNLCARERAVSRIFSPAILARRVPAIPLCAMPRARVARDART